MNARLATTLCVSDVMSTDFLAVDPAGIGLFELARMMGTSVVQIDKTYGHLLPDSIDRARAALETFGRGMATEEKAEGESLSRENPA
jgi:hypothetical protein